MAAAVVEVHLAVADPEAALGVAKEVVARVAATAGAKAEAREVAREAAREVALVAGSEGATAEATGVG